MPPKKKKPATKNVNRGFATTSIPKKVAPPEQTADESSPHVGDGAKGQASEEQVDGAPAATAGSAQSSKGAESKEEWDPADQEERELQALAERIRPICEKEIAKQIKVIDFENRLSRTLPKFAWHDSRFQEDVLELALRSEVEQPRSTIGPEAEEKALQQVVILFSILQKLDFRAERITECLKAIRNLDLDEAMDWLLLHCPTEELAARGLASSDSPAQSERPDAPTPAERSSAPSTAPTPPRLPSAMRGTRAASAADVDELTADLKKRILAFDDEASATRSSDPNTVEYVALKLELAELAKKIPSAGGLKGKALKNAAKARKDHKAVEDKIKLVQATYNFDQRLADEALKVKLAELQPEELNGAALEISEASAEITPADSQESSTLPSPASGTADSASAPVSPMLSTSDPQPEVCTDSKEPQDDSDEEGGMFGDLLNEMPEQEVSDNNTIVTVRDLPLPRQFSGKTPRSLLEDAIRRQDKYAQTRYRIISRSRAVRASVDVRWQGGKVDTHSMEEEACYDETQAYNYVATVALFAISPAPTNRLLPPGFRELWEELEAKRKTEDDRGYVEHLKTLMTIVKDRASAEPMVAKSSKSGLPGAGVSQNEPAHRSFPSVPPQVLQQDFLARQQWPSYQEMLLQRNTLPIAAYRNALVSAIQSNQVIILCGETGCGKSTQLPSFLLENELQNGRLVKIFCTEPRRISAISLANRVSQELGEAPGTVGQRGSLVGYNIRLEAKASASTRLIYATTGIVLRMLEGGDDLDDMTHLIIDEVHERSIDSDFLLIALKTILERRPELRVVLMSATVDAEKLSTYMRGAPVLQVPGRTFPVTTFFLEDAIEQSGYYLDSASDSMYLSRFNKKRPPQIRTEDDAPQLDDEDDQAASSLLLSTAVYSKRTRATLDVLDENAINFDLLLLLLEKICIHDQHLVRNFSHAILIFLPSLETIRKAVDVLESHPVFGSNAFQIFPLHSTVSNENQSLVFNRPPPGVRKIVVSTNIAETGVTIPDVTCCIDSGKHKEMRYDEKRQISRLVETFIARSNATQRRGRAGRVQEGICYHLFTRARMEYSMAEEPLPEMLRLSLQDLALRIKIMRLGDSIEETLLKALDPPSVTNISRAIQSLVEVKALTASQEITPLGRHLVKLPMDVHMGKLLILGCMFGCLSPALTVAAALNSKSPFLTPFGREREADTVKRSFKVENSDFLTICKVYELWRDHVKNGTHFPFCRKNFLSHPNFSQIEELRVQFYGLLVDGGFVTGSGGATSTGRGRLRFCNVPASYDVNTVDNKVVMSCIAAAMFPKLLVRDTSRQWRTFTNNAPASVHPTSVNFAPGRRLDFGDSEYVTYFNIMQSKKLYVWECGGVDERAVLLLCGEADFKLPALSLSIDRKIKTAVGPKAAVSLRLLRSHFHQIFNQKMRNPSRPLTGEQQAWFDLIISAVAEPRDVRRQLLGIKEDAEQQRKPTMKVTLAPAPAADADVADDSIASVPQE